jgi:hypothetical protein
MPGAPRLMRRGTNGYKTPRTEQEEQGATDPGPCTGTPLKAAGCRRVRRHPKATTGRTELAPGMHDGPCTCTGAEGSSGPAYNHIPKKTQRVTPVPNRATHYQGAAGSYVMYVTKGLH